MNVILDKLKPVLNDDCIGEIKDFLYDQATGYTFTELDCIKTLKARKRYRFLRIGIELMTWKKRGLSITWLKPVRLMNGDLYMGAYINVADELFFIKQAGIQGTISELDADIMINEVSTFN